ncbi:MAG TPA: winged helix-turn-helix domain-containing protein [Nitrososphaeraceae archaeon]|nr:winged helix-turn-helix domain-containing protein [Nitrososphaeraceae archaeon]
MKNEGSIEIVALILQTAINGTTPTKLLYRVFLSYKQLKEHLTILKKNNLLVEYIGKEQTFRTTRKGQLFLQLYLELNEIVNVTNNRSIATVLHSILLTRTHVLEYYVIHFIYCLISMILSMIQKIK